MQQGNKNIRIFLKIKNSAVNSKNRKEIED